MRKIAFCFPGQGSQRVGMGRELAEAVPQAAAVFDRANELLGFDLRALCFDGPLDQLSRTEITQPALMAASLASLRAVEQGSGLRADVVVGHSVGEYAALAAAGAAQPDDLLRLVHERGRISAAAGEGGMAAVLKLDDERVEQLCAARDDVWPANYNCPGQVVISGLDAGLDAVAEAVRDEGGKVIRLKVAGAFHSPLMAGAARRFAPAVEAVAFTATTVDFMSTVTSRLEPADRAGALLVEQLTAPVRFTQAVRSLIAMGVDTFVELGPGGVLTGLVKRIDDSVRAVSIATPAELAAAQEVTADA
ncbi:MAG: [acyl-carrier-protein] S-malonyltransferase [Solirubrobacteraceae bacterium]|nr:[acyl-carrier-protein] S-malonyltransferase [Solirubrobacteraceae bacterium]